MDRREFVRLAGSGMAAGAIAETLVSAQVAQNARARQSQRGGVVKGEISCRHAARRFRRHSQGDGRLRRQQHLRQHAVGEARREMVRRGADEASRARRVVRHQARHDGDHDDIGVDRSRADARDHFWRGPERDSNIDDICTQIRNCAKAGIFQVKYNFTIVGIPRSGRVKGRGPSTYSEFVLEKDANKDKPTIAGKVSADEYWERITYFLERVVPVAEEYKVKMGCHPQDPGVPRGYRGIEEVPLATPAGLRRFVKIKESPYHGLNFCQGTVSEQLKNPGEEIHDVIRSLKGKIFNVHFRNIEGGYLNFREIVHRQRQRRHAAGGAHVQGNRLRRHADAGPRAERRRRSRSQPGIRIRARLHQGGHRGGVGRSVETKNEERKTNRATEGGSGTWTRPFFFSTQRRRGATSFNAGGVPTSGRPI